jgi:hypothetical protein
MDQTGLEPAAPLDQGAGQVESRKRARPAPSLSRISAKNAKIARQPAMCRMVEQEAPDPGPNNVR